MNFRLSSMAARRPRPQREARPGVLDRTRGDLLEAHRAPALEDRERRVQRAGNDRRIESGAVESLLVRSRTSRSWRPSAPSPGRRSRSPCVAARIDEHQPLAAEAVQILLDDAARRAARRRRRRTRCRPSSGSRTPRRSSADGRPTRRRVVLRREAAPPRACRRRRARSRTRSGTGRVSCGPLGALRYTRL